MYVLIDTTNWRALARHDGYKALAALAVIQFANIDTQIVGLGGNQAWAAFDSKQLASIAASLGMKLATKTPYPEQIKAVRAAVESVEWLALPYATADLEAQGYQVKPDDARPLGFDPEGTAPKLLRAWPSEPQRNRKRSDSSYWYCFAAGLGYGPGVATPEALAHLKGEHAPPPPRRKPGAGVSQAPSAPVAPKPPRPASSPAQRPKAGSKTAAVWDLADQLWKGDEGDIKAFRAQLLKACEAAGINAGTMNVQYGKWKSSKGL